MRKIIFYFSFLTLSFLMFYACEKEKKVTISIPKYSVSIDSTFNKNAPSLQSFAHGTSGSEWLLFAGRTNKSSDEGGLHDMSKKSNYADTSFPPASFNETIDVYNPILDVAPTSITISKLKEVIANNFTSYDTDTINKYVSVFKNTNPLVKQVDDYLYVIGGYGAIDFEKPKKGYETYNQIVRIHVPSMIQLVKERYLDVVESKLFAFAQNKNLVSTGGELHYFGKTFYLVGGHNFGNTAANGQKYVDAVYPFSVGPKIVNKDTIKHVLALSMETAISDVSDPDGDSSDDTSIFRRRDGPITPSLYFNSFEKKLEESIAIYAGVFKPGEDLQAWNDAIYVHPNWQTENNKLYTYDKDYD